MAVGYSDAKTQSLLILRTSRSTAEGPTTRRRLGAGPRATTVTCQASRTLSAQVWRPPSHQSSSPRSRGQAETQAQRQDHMRGCDMLVPPLSRARCIHPFLPRVWRFSALHVQLSARGIKRLPCGLLSRAFSFHACAVPCSVQIIAQTSRCSSQGLVIHARYSCTIRVTCQWSHLHGEIHT
jgi:hypothetical protein